MIRIVCLWLAGAAVLTAQEKPASALGAWQQVAEKAAANSDALAKGLEAKIARLLPCDPRVRSAIEEVNRASEVRMAALRAYLEALAAQAKEDSDAVKQLIAYWDALAIEMKSDSAEAEQQRVGIEGQLLELGESAKQRAALEGAQKTLAQIAAVARQLAIHDQDQTGKVNALGGLLKNLDAAYQARQTALKNEMAALDAEGARWAEYYSARLARAQIECSLTKQIPANPAPPPADRKKP